MRRQSRHNKRSLREKGDFTLFKKITIQLKRRYRDFSLCYSICFIISYSRCNLESVNLLILDFSLLKVCDRHIVLKLSTLCLFLKYLCRVTRLWNYTLKNPFKTY